MGNSFIRVQCYVIMVQLDKLHQGGDDEYLQSWECLMCLFIGEVSLYDTVGCDTTDGRYILNGIC